MFVFSLVRKTCTLIYFILVQTSRTTYYDLNQSFTKLSVTTILSREMFYSCIEAILTHTHHLDVSGIIVLARIPGYSGVIVVNCMQFFFLHLKLCAYFSKWQHLCSSFQQMHRYARYSEG